MSSHPLPLVDLLQASVAATSAGDHATSWRLTSQFGTRHWLADPATDLPQDAPAHLRTEFHVLRAAVADRLELHEESAEAVMQWRRLARETGDDASSVLADSALCLVAMVVESDGVDLADLPPAARLLDDLHASILAFRPDADGPTLGEDASITGATLPRHQATCLSLAAMGGLTCATSLATPETAPLRPVFRELADRFTVNGASAGDRELTRAQQLHAEGEVEAAVAVATTMLASDSPTTRYAAHDLLGYFALTEDANDPVLEHWRQCAEIALELGAPLEGMHRAEQACQLLNADGDYAAAHDLAVRVDEAAAGAPVSPAVLNLRAVRARAAIGVGNLEEGLALAVATADWSMFSPDTERTLACLTMACVAASTSGQHVVTANLLERSCTLYRELDRPLAAAQALRTAAREHLNVGDTSRAVEMMERSRRILEGSDGLADDPMFSWHLGDWNEDMSAIWEDAGREDLALEYATRAARSFTDARDHSSAAMNWVAAASLHLELGQNSSCDVALDRAHGELLMVPEETGVEDDGFGEADPDDDPQYDLQDAGDEGSVWQAYRQLRQLRES
ncbi:MAG: hypothetical protein L0J86_04935 [Corynebacterium sp.]|nr:hypothetical protein [Corynebacterium sp.]